ncbi:MAG TPA: PDZ domain-containing protein [Gammaproteobacteria bacterium]|nr:PDZ domain-containing protein [Gammaproteobacteria bacterium]
MNNRSRWYAALALGLLGAAAANAQPEVEAQAEAVRELARAREEAARAQAESMREYERAQQEARRAQVESMREFAMARQEAERAQAESARELARAREQLEQAARQLALLSGKRADRSGATRAPFVYSGRATLGINLDLEPTELGVRVVGVTPGGPAADAGVVVDDVIVAIEGTDLTGLGPPSPTDRLLEQTRDLSPDQNLALRVLRDGDYHDLTVLPRASAPWALRSPKLVMPAMPAMPAMPTMPSMPSMAAVPGLRISPFGVGAWADLELVPLTPGLGTYFGVDKGLLVVRAAADGPLGFRDGDVIVDIGGREPLGPEHALRILSSFEPGETMRVTIMRQRRRETLELTMPTATTPA